MGKITTRARPGFRRVPIRPRARVASSARVIDRLDELDGLSAVWDSVSGARASPMQHFIWSRACAETFSADYSLRVLTVGPARRPSAIAPLVGRHGLPMRPALQVASLARVPVRLYVPYGEAWLPYCLSQAQQNPHIIWWAFKDLFSGWTQKTRQTHPCAPDSSRLF